MTKEPALGYPSKKAAAVALHAEGKTLAEIASLIGSSIESVRLSLKAAGVISAPRGRRGSAQDPSSLPVWSAEKRDKVRRLFGRTMIYIAEAVDVPPAELLRYVLHGVVPPSHTVMTEEEIAWRSAEAPPAPIAALPPPEHDGPAEAEQEPGEPDQPPPEPSRAEDEAELAAMEEEPQGAREEPPTRMPAAELPATALLAAPPPAEDAPAAAPEPEDTPARFRLQNPSGAWLAKDLKKFTWRLPESWTGTASDIERIGRINRRFLELEPMRAP